MTLSINTRKYISPNNVKTQSKLLRHTLNINDYNEQENYIM